jgi:NADPH:quinone reductase-like Zn-dependent oxidoreductase
VAAALPISGLTAWQGLIDHARLTTGQTVLVHGAAGGVGSIAVQLAREVIGGEILDRSTALVRASGTLVTIARMPTVQPKDGRAMFFVVEADRSRLADLAQRLRDGRLKPIVGAVRPLAEAPVGFVDRRTPGKTIVQITEGG